MPHNASVYIILIGGGGGHRIGWVDGTDMNACHPISDVAVAHLAELLPATIGQQLDLSVLQGQSIQHALR